MGLINQIEAEGLDLLWYQLLQDICCGKNVYYNYPNIYKRFTLATSTGLKFESSQIVKDFFRFSHYDYKTKMRQLKGDYFDDRVQSQLDVVKEHLREFHPRQARAVIYFSREAYDISSRLKCLESLYFQKTDMLNFSAFLIFRNTEVMPKSLMDFILVRKIIKEVEVASGCKCKELNCVVMNSFISIHHAATSAMFLKRWGVSNWNESFLRMLTLFKEKFSDMDKIEQLKMQSIKRALVRFHHLREDFGYSLEEICK